MGAWGLRPSVFVGAAGEEGFQWPPKDDIEDRWVLGFVLGLGAIPGVDSSSILFNHRSSKTCTSCSLGFWRFSGRMPGKNGEGSPRAMSFHALDLFWSPSLLRVARGWRRQVHSILVPFLGSPPDMVNPPPPKTKEDKHRKWPASFTTRTKGGYGKGGCSLVQSRS